MNKFISVVLIFVSFYYVKAQEGYPKPTNKDGLLFYIQHNRGKNTFIYALNLNDDRKINLENPIRVYRQIFDKNGEIKPLTTIQKNFAYGIDTKRINNNFFEASIVSLPTQKFNLIIPAKGKPFVETTVNGMKFIVNRIYIKQKDGTSGLSTKVDYILFYGIHDKKDIIQRLNID